MNIRKNGLIKIKIKLENISQTILKTDIIKIFYLKLKQITEID